MAGQGNAQLGSAAITVGVTSTRILSFNPARVYAAIVNDSAQEVYLGLGPVAVLNAGIRLNNSGGSFECGVELGPDYVGDIFAIASAPSIVTVVEIYDYDRLTHGPINTNLTQPEVSSIQNLLSKILKELEVGRLGR